MKKKLIVMILGTAVLLGGCQNGGEPSSDPAAVTTEAPTDGAEEVTPTEAPTPTPIPLPENYINAPEEWTQLTSDSEGWVMPEWLDGHKGILEWDSGKGATIISTVTDKEPVDAADSIITRFDSAVAANAYASAGDCTVETAYFGNAIGFFIAPKWGEKTYCCFVVGNISSGVGWDLAMTALANYEQFSLYDYNLQKMLNVRINADGNARIMDDGYWNELITKASEMTGWTEEENKGYRDSAQGIYKLISSQNNNVDVTERAEGKSETIYTIDGIRVCDVHLPEGFTDFEEYNNPSTKERYMYVNSNDFSLVIDGAVPTVYDEYLYDLVWNERKIVFWGEGEEELEEVGEEPVETGEGENEEGAEPTEAKPTEEEKPTEEPKEGEGETAADNPSVRLLDLFDCGEGRVYLFAEVPAGTPDNAKYSETELTGYTVVFYREDGLGCSMYVSSKIYNNKKKVLETARQLFL